MIPPLMLLTAPWPPLNVMNPPFSAIRPWLNRSVVPPPPTVNCNVAPPLAPNNPLLVTTFPFNEAIRLLSPEIGFCATNDAPPALTTDRDATFPTPAIVLKFEMVPVLLLRRIVPPETEIVPLFTYVEPPGVSRFSTALVPIVPTVAPLALV